MNNVVQFVPRQRVRNPGRHTNWGCIIAGLFTLGCWAALGVFMCWEMI